MFAFTSERSELGLTELTEILDLPKSTVHRAIANLEVRGLLVRNEVTNKYHLGSRLFELGMRASLNFDLREIARPYLEKLSKETGEMITLAILSEDEALYLDKVDSSRVLRAASAVGQRRPLHCTAVGKVMLSDLPQHEVVRIVEEKGLAPRTSRTITDPDDLNRKLTQIRSDGYSLDLGEFEEGLCCVATPIMDGTGKITASIGVSGPVTRFNEEARPGLIKLMQQTAEEISKELGYEPIISES
ncbi:MAG: IclR family transcriptional regulator [Chloroflexota bacterium]